MEDPIQPIIEDSKDSAPRAGDGRQIGRDLLDSLSIFGIHLRNAVKRARKARVDYVVLPVGGPLPERAAPKRGFLERRLPLPPEPLSLETLNEQLRDVADADNVRGVVLVFRRLSAAPATLQNFRAAIARLRAAGKEVIVYTPYVDLAHYYAATAADRIIIPPGSQFEVLGLFSELTFLKDALARVGVQAEVMQISPYKTAMDRFSRDDISPEHREQVNRLLDDLYDMLVTDMAAGRGLDEAALRRLIDAGPLTAEAARDAGLVDGVAYDDELALWLEKQARPEAAGELDEKKRKVMLKEWAQARRLMLEKPRRRGRRFVGVVSLEGLIAMGASRRPPIELPIPLIGDTVAGEQTLVNQLRRASKQRRMAALVFHVDSGGGSALASDLIGREVERLAGRIPVVVYMGNVAGSGGYYVSAPARHIISQRATMTGSIGVVTARLNAEALYDRLAINRVTFERGEHAGLYRDSRPLTPEEKAIHWRTISHIYEQFKEVVSRGRGLPVERVDEIGGGRVYTGRQAQTIGLVDAHGDFLDAIKKAAELAALPFDDIHAIPVRNLPATSSRYTLPDPGKGASLEALGRLLGGEALRQLCAEPLLLLPYQLRLW